MLAFLGYTVAVIITLAIVPAGIAIGVYAFKEIPSGLSFVKAKLDNRKKDSLDIELEEKQAKIEWLKDRDRKFTRLDKLNLEEEKLMESDRRKTAQLKEKSWEDEVLDSYLND